MSFSSGMQAGANIYNSSKRSSNDRDRLIVNRPRTEGVSLGSKEQYSTKEDPGQAAAKTAKYEASRDKLAHTQEEIFKNQQGKAYDAALAAISVGNTRLAEDYISQFGAKGVSANINVDADGKVTVKPTGGGEGFTFNDTKDFYVNFFAAMKPERSKFAPGGRPKAADQDWEQIADGTKILDTKSGKMIDTGYAGRKGGRSGSGSGSGSSANDKLWYEKFDDQIGKHFSRKLVNLKADEMGEDFSEDFYKNDDGTWNLDQIYKDLPDEEKRKFDVSRAQGEQHKNDGVAGYTAGVLATRSMDANKSPRTYQDFDPDNEQDVQELYQQIRAGSGIFKDPESAMAEMQKIRDVNPKLAFRLEEANRRAQIMERGRNGNSGMGSAAAANDNIWMSISSVSGMGMNGMNTLKYEQDNQPKPSENKKPSNRNGLVSANIM